MGKSKPILFSFKGFNSFAGTYPVREFLACNAYFQVWVLAGACGAAGNGALTKGGYRLPLPRTNPDHGGFL